jgi:hypothetical protein
MLSALPQDNDFWLRRAHECSVIRRQSKTRRTLRAGWRIFGTTPPVPWDLITPMVKRRSRVMFSGQ